MTERGTIMSRLAINGGTPVRNVKSNPWPKWPVWDKREEKALLERAAQRRLVLQRARGEAVQQGVRRVSSAAEVRAVAGERDRHAAIGPGGVRGRVRRRGHRAGPDVAGDGGGGPGHQRGPHPRGCHRGHLVHRPGAGRGGDHPANKAIIPVHLYGCIGRHGRHPAHRPAARPAASSRTAPTSTAASGTA